MKTFAKTPGQQNEDALQSFWRRVRRLPDYARCILFLIFLLFLLQVLKRSTGPQYESVMDLMDRFLITAILGLGLNIVVGFAGLLDLGYVGFYALGAYTYALMASPLHGNHWPIYILLPLGGLIAGIFGIVLGVPTLRLRGDYLAIVTLGFSEIIRIVFSNLQGLTNGAVGVINIDVPNFANLNFVRLPFADYNLFNPSDFYYFYGVILVAILFIIMRLENSRIGRAWTAIREDEIAAASMGINLTKTKLLAFGMGATFGGMAGVLFASRIHFIDPSNFSFDVSVSVLIVVILGGMGSIPGVLVAAFLLELTNWTLGTYLTDATFGAFPLIGPVLKDNVNIFGSLGSSSILQMRNTFYAIAMILLMIFRPQGLLPSSRRKRELVAAGEVSLQEKASLYDVTKDEHPLEGDK